MGDGDWVKLCPSGWMWPVTSQGSKGERSVGGGVVQVGFRQLDMCSHDTGEKREIRQAVET